MYKDLDKYQPKDIEYVLEDRVKELFPLELDFKQISDRCATPKGAVSFIDEHFTATFPQGERATRKLDKYEITNIREEYCVITEEQMPKLQEKVQELKQMLKDADDALKSKALEIERYASEVRAGVKESKLKTNETFQISLCGYYVTYTYDKEKEVFVLAKAFKIPDASELWASEGKNREAMAELFGYEFPDAQE